MNVHNREMKLTVGQMLTDVEAKKFLGDRQFVDGGGWASYLTDDGRDLGLLVRRSAYVCNGMHRDLRAGWQVKEVK